MRFLSFIVEFCSLCIVNEKNALGMKVPPRHLNIHPQAQIRPVWVKVPKNWDSIRDEHAQ